MSKIQVESSNMKYIAPAVASDISVGIPNRNERRGTLVYPNPMMGSLPAGIIFSNMIKKLNFNEAVPGLAGLISIAMNQMAAADIASAATYLSGGSYKIPFEKKYCQCAY